MLSGYDQQMRKRVISPGLQETAVAREQWLDLERLATIEVTSESPAFPIESALLPGAHSGVGWRAAYPGEQMLRILFDIPQRLTRIRLCFRESEQVRTQEFSLRYSQGEGTASRELLRQQYNFSPPQTTEELEVYRVDLEGVTTLELLIVPDVSGGRAVASLAELRLG